MLKSSVAAYKPQCVSIRRLKIVLHRRPYVLIKSSCQYLPNRLNDGYSRFVAVKTDRSDAVVNKLELMYHQ